MSDNDNDSNNKRVILFIETGIQVKMDYTGWYFLIVPLPTTETK